MSLPAEPAIGSNLVHRLVCDGNRVTVVDNLSSGTLRNLEGLVAIEFVHGDIRDRSLLNQAFCGADVLFRSSTGVCPKVG